MIVIRVYLCAFKLCEDVRNPLDFKSVFLNAIISSAGSNMKEGVSPTPPSSGTKISLISRICSQNFKNYVGLAGASCLLSLLHVRVF